MACMSRADTLHKADTQSTIEERVACWCTPDPDDRCKWMKNQGIHGDSQECGTYWFMAGCTCGDCPCHSQ